MGDLLEKQSVCQHVLGPPLRSALPLGQASHLLQDLTQGPGSKKEEDGGREREREREGWAEGQREERNTSGTVQA